MRHVYKQVRILVRLAKDDYKPKYILTHSKINKFKYGINTKRVEKDF